MFKTNIMTPREDLLKRIELIENDVELTEKFREKFQTTFEMARAAAGANWMKKSAEKFIRKITKDLVVI
tara:strand:+ start:404 stop:610 length:207 start_codon:yes stop_codon:yes gene_type:complete